MAKQKPVLKTTLKEVFFKIKNFIANSNLTLEDVANLTDTDADFIMMFIENTDEITEKLDRIINFSNVRLYSRNAERVKKPIFYKFIYNFRSSAGTVKIKRIVKPICTAIYNPITTELYNFRAKEDLSEAHKQLIANEMYDFIDKPNSQKFINKKIQ